LDRLRAARGEEHAIEVAGGEARDPLGELDGPRVGGVPGRRVGELARLGAGRLGELGPAVAGVDAEQRRERVEVTAALRVPERAAVAAHEDRELVVAADRREV